MRLRAVVGGLVIVGAAVLTPVAMANAAPASRGSAAGQPETVRGKRVYPTVSGAAQKRAAGEAKGLAALPLRYGGGVDSIGVTTGAPKVYIVFWGNQWGT